MDKDEITVIIHKIIKSNFKHQNKYKKSILINLFILFFFGIKYSLK